jgi:hypothetical protein
MLPTEVNAFERDRLEELASRPNTTVLQPEYASVRDPWPAKRLRCVMEGLMARVLSFGEDVDDFVVRKTCLEENEEVLAFQRQHPRMYWMLTDRALMKEQSSRDAITGMLYVREQVECGAVQEGRDADAMATKTVLAALGKTG